RSLRASFSLRLGKGSGVRVFDHEGGAYQSCVCPVLVRVMPGTGAAGLGGGDENLLGAGSSAEACETPVGISGQGVACSSDDGAARADACGCGIRGSRGGGSKMIVGAGRRRDGFAGAPEVGAFPPTTHRFICSMTEARTPLGGLEAGGFISSSSVTRALASRRPSGVVSFLPWRRARERETRPV